MGEIEVLPDDECARLLRAHDLGRLAVVDEKVRPLIFPVNYYFQDRVVAFRTGPGSKLDLAPGSHVCFEIDGWDPETRVGWSVVVKGTAHDITHPRGAPASVVRFWPVRPVAPGSRESWIAIEAHEVTGRRFQAERVAR